MPKDQIFMGLSVALLSAAACWKCDWLLEHTRKGQWFVRYFGPGKARRVVRTLFFFAAVFGVLLATNIIRPLQW